MIIVLFVAFHIKDQVALCLVSTKFIVLLRLSDSIALPVVSSRVITMSMLLGFFKAYPAEFVLAAPAEYKHTSRILFYLNVTVRTRFGICFDPLDIVSITGFFLVPQLNLEAAARSMVFQIAALKAKHFTTITFNVALIKVH